MSIDQTIVNFISNEDLSKGGILVIYNDNVSTEMVQAVKTAIKKTLPEGQYGVAVFAADLDSTIAFQPIEADGIVTIETQDTLSQKVVDAIADQMRRSLKRQNLLVLSVGLDGSEPVLSTEPVAETT